MGGASYCGVFVSATRTHLSEWLTTDRCVILLCCDMYREREWYFVAIFAMDIRDYIYSLILSTFVPHDQGVANAL